MMMKRLFALSVLTIALLAAAPFTLAQSSPPPLPALTAEQSASVQQRLDAYRNETEDRVSRGEITADEADRLLAWREWQIARQVAGAASTPTPSAQDDVPPDYRPPVSAQGDVPPDYRPPVRQYVPPREYVVVEPPAYYGPYYRYPAPYYWAPRPYYWGPAVCAGGFGRHFGGRICF
jgi:hypothetical protein